MSDTQREQEQKEREFDIRRFEQELSNHIYDFVRLRDNMRSYSTYLSVKDLRKISDKAAKTAGRILANIAVS